MSERHEIPAQKADEIIVLEHVCSQEQVTDENGVLIPLLNDITFSMKSGEIWGIGSSAIAEADVLTRIIGNTCAYYSGRCKIGRIGSIQKKRRLLPHIFNIDTPEMMIDNINLLEQLLLSTMNINLADKLTRDNEKQVIKVKHNKKRNMLDDIVREEEMISFLDSFGLSKYTLVKIGQLLPQEKLMAELLIAALSESDIIVFNILDYQFNQEQIELLKNICSFAKAEKKAILIATAQPKLIGMVCDHVVFINKGKLKFSGSVDDLCRHADKVTFVLKSSEAAETAQKIEALMPKWKCDISSDNIYIFNYSSKENDPASFYRFLADNGIYPDSIKLNRGRVENSFIELMRTE
ncbi:MAG: hypothetical protein VB118_02395 [Oscillospiraceae bacterium]|nr:hypothetical protein [Oscillospiraceae bacterium]